MSNKPKKPVSLENKALDLLSRRRLSRGELKIKLMQRSYAEDKIDALLDRYVELGYLDDKTLAHDIAGWKIEAKPMGRRSLMAEMYKRKIPEDLAEAAVDKVFTEQDESELAEKALYSILRRTLDKNKIFDRMRRLGFGYADIKSAMDKLEPEGGYIVKDREKG